MSARPTVYLFDIDGTLLLTGGAGRRAMAAAFTDAHGPRGAAALDFPFAGMTDRAIVRTALHALGVDESVSHEAFEPLVESYLVHLASQVARSDYRIMPGVEAVLGWLTPMVSTARIAIGLGTGNVKRGAYTKLARGSLDKAFAFGGFGCDHEDRVELLRIGAKRGADALGLEIDECRVVVIGDTPKDVAAALGIGADCIGVGTGGFEPRTLLELGARYAFATLEEAGVREALLINAP